jgi:hypothetical protein
MTLLGKTSTYHSYMCIPSHPFVSHRSLDSIDDILSYVEEFKA